MPPINNQKGLDALKALASGGSQGLNAYKQAQSQEAAARTSALQGALGDNDVAAAAQRAQAQFAPKVASGDLGIGNLDVAADNYLSRASNKLAAQKYEDQQRLALQTEALERQKTEISPQERMLQLQGAAEVMAQKQRDDLAQNMTLDQSLNNMAARKAGLRQQLTAFDQQAPLTDPAVVTALASAGTPEAAAQLQALNEQAAERQAQRQNILNQMGAMDQQAMQASQQYAGMLGTDNKGFMEAYAKADRGDTQAMQDLNRFLGKEGGMRETAEGQLERQIAVGGQERLRALAPAFGINPLTAAGQFREGEGDDLSRVGQLGKEEAFIAGEMSPAQKKAFNNEQAASLGFESGTAYERAKNVTKMDDQAIQSFMESDDWAEVSTLANAFAQGDTSITGEATGLQGFRERIQNYVNGGFDVVDGKEVPWDKKKQQQIADLAREYYNSRVRGSAGTGETAE